MRLISLNEVKEIEQNGRKIKSKNRRRQMAEILRQNMKDFKLNPIEN